MTSEDEDDTMVMSMVEEDGTARMTVSLNDEDHLFSVSIEQDGDELQIEHEESQLWRGMFESSEPRDEIYDRLLESEPFQEFIEDFKDR